MPLRSIPPSSTSGEAAASREAPHGGRFILGDEIEHRCQTVAITSTEATLRAAVRGRIGERVVCYLDQYGRVEGRIARLVEDGFAIELTAPARKREKLARQLTWQANRPLSHETQRDERIEPTQKRVVLRLPDGRHVAAQIINLSRTGAALTCPVELGLDSTVLVGRRVAQVVRVTQRLAAVEFAEPIDASAFRRDIVL